MKLAPVLLVIAVLLVPLGRSQEVREVPVCKFSPGGKIGALNQQSADSGTIAPCQLPDGMRLEKTSTLYYGGAAIFVMSGAIAIGLYFAIRWAYRLGKAQIILWDRDARSIRLLFAKPHDGKVVLGAKTFLLDGLAKHGGAYSTWVIDPATGWNFVIPTRKETHDADMRIAVLEASNPESYHRALHRHRWSDVLRAGEEDKNNWVPILVVGGVIVVLAILGTVMWIASHLPSAQGGS